MPGLSRAAKLDATINFVLPRANISREDQAKYLARYDVNDMPPKDTVNVPLYDLRDEFEQLGPAEQQLDERGYAAIKHHSSFASVEGLKSVETTDAYLKECQNLYKNVLAADEVIVWNSVVRANSDVAVPDTKETRQKAVQKNAAPDIVKAISSSAHVDQDEEYARVIAKRAAGDNVFEKYRRVQIINLWRPLQGPVTNAPLAVCSYRSMSLEEDVMRAAGAYGTYWAVSHSPGQQWSYISHQMPDEVLLLKCYDSEMGSQGQALFSAHTACEPIDEPLPDGIEEGTALEPRTSIEVRLIVLHK